ALANMNCIQSGPGQPGCRHYQPPAVLYRQALNHVIYEPTGRNIYLSQRFMGPLKRLAKAWWDKIRDCRRYGQHQDAIQAYQKTLRPGDLTLLGLVCEGAQGMATGDNGRFLGYLEGTPQAEQIRKRQVVLESTWLADTLLGPRCRRLKDQGLDFPELAD